MRPQRERDLPAARRARRRGQRRRALERGRREVLRRHHQRVEVLDVFGELAPLERVRRLVLKSTARGWEVRFREVLVWRGGRGS